jgi:hypothetical protein
LALVGGKGSASLLGRFTPGGKSPQYPLYRRLGGPRAGLDNMEKLIASHYTDYAIQDHIAVLWVIILYNLTGGYKSFKGTKALHLQGTFLP